MAEPVEVRIGRHRGEAVSAETEHLQIGERGEETQVVRQAEMPGVEVGQVGERGDGREVGGQRRADVELA